MRLFLPAASVCLLTCFVPPSTWAVEDEKVPKPAVQPMKGTEMLFGPVLSCSVEVPGRKPSATAEPAKRPNAPKVPPTQMVAKGIAIKLGDQQGTMCFDADLLRMAVGWTGGFLDLKQTNIGVYKGNGTGAGVVKGDVQFETLALPGWSVDGEFADPREEKNGPLPREVGNYKGMYLHGDRVVLSYTVAGCDVLESPELKTIGDRRFLLRTFEVAPSNHAMSLLLDLPAKEADRVEGVDAVIDEHTTPATLSVSRGERMSVLAVNGAPAGAKFQSVPAGIALTLPPLKETTRFTVAIWSGAAAEKPAVSESDLPAAKLADLCKGGASRWPALPPMSGTVSTEKAAYVVDTIPLPDHNPWKSWMRLSAFDFLPDGRAVVATLNGDVWLVSGLDAKLESVRWKRFATGLYEPLGVKVKDGTIYVHGKDQITRLKDLNGDDEADFYESFNHDRYAVTNYHTFAFDLQTDRAGNFYYVTGGNQLGAHRPWHASIVRVSPDGAKSETVATGFRAPNGLTVGPNDEIIVSDNQGQWIPSSKLSLIRPGGFYGHVADPRLDAKAVAPAGYDQPLCWVPMAMDNSSAGGVWDSDNGKWGPFGGHLLHLSFGTASLFAVLPERTSTAGAVLPSGGAHQLPEMQGSVVKFPLRFVSGSMRARFHPGDGQLYVTGLKGWQTVAAKDGCFQRVRYTGETVTMPIAMHAAKDTLKLEFATALDRKTAADAQAFSVEQWNYQWWSTYGSPDLSPSRPGQKKRDLLDVTAATLSPDGRSLTLTIPGLQFAMQTLLKGNLQFADGTEAKLETAGTYYNLP